MFSFKAYAKNTVISPNFLVWKFCGKAQFPHSFGRFAQNLQETVPFHKITHKEKKEKKKKEKKRKPSYHLPSCNTPLFYLF